MKKTIYNTIKICILILTCFVITSCSIDNNTRSDNKIYTDFDDKLYFKGSLYSLKSSFINTTFYFPILSTNKVNDIDNVELFNGDNRIDGTATFIPETRDDKIINENLYLNFVGFQLNIQNINGINISQIKLDADGIKATYNVDINLYYYYLNPEYKLMTQVNGLYEHNDNTCTLICGYTSLSTLSRFNYLESMVEGIDITKIEIAEGGKHDHDIGESPWDFNEINNDSTNNLAYKNNVLKISCDFSEISKQTVFFKDAFKANLSIGDEIVEIMLPEVTSNPLIELYKMLAQGLQLEG